jgi:hypothetical protein
MISFPLLSEKAVVADPLLSSTAKSQDATQQVLRLARSSPPELGE